MKLANFAALNPNYPSKGLRPGGRRDREVWDRFADSREELQNAAQRIRAGALTDDLPRSEEEGEEGVLEGRILFRLHRQRERNRDLVRRKKTAAQKRDGRLACEVCGFDFAAKYGDLGDGFIECHHVLPLAQADERPTRLEDLALVCSNCHRMLHRGEPWKTTDELRATFRRY